MHMQFFIPMKPPTTTHNDKQLHAYMKGGQPHAVLHDMTRLHFWHDDAQVCSEIVEKFWADPCGVFVMVEELA